jgi:hypothetical protein
MWAEHTRSDFIWNHLALWINLVLGNIYSDDEFCLIQCLYEQGNYSRSYCLFCTWVKQLFTRLGASFKAIELDVEGEWTKHYLVFHLTFRAVNLIWLYIRWVTPRAGTQNFRRDICLSWDVLVVLFRWDELHIHFLLIKYRMCLRVWPAKEFNKFNIAAPSHQLMDLSSRRTVGMFGCTRDAI